MKETPIISLKNLVVKYGDTTVIPGLDLEIMDKEFVTLLGPSGCGKTTILRVIGGFEEATKGEVSFYGKDITKLPPYKRPVNTVFQKYSLFPHLNVYENIAFGLRVGKKQSDEKIGEIVSEMLKLVNLEGYEKRNINTLSGGQQQRIAIARALANKPKILLLDEPLAALDLKLRKEMQRELKEIQETLDITFIFVTHDQEEALTMSDRVIVLKEGEIQQNGTPEDIYNEPNNAYVADFIGESNILDGIMLEDYKVEFAGTEFACMDSGFEELEDVDVVIRPEDIKIVSVDEGDMIGTVQSIRFKGVHYEIIVESTGYSWIIHSTGYVDEETVIGMNLYPDDIHIMKKMEEE